VGKVLGGVQTGAVKVLCTILYVNIQQIRIFLNHISVKGATRDSINKR